MTLFFPFAISQLGETRVSVKRIQDFLLMEEREEQGGERVTFAHGEDDEEKDTIILDKVTGKWRKDKNEDTLKNINLNTKPGQLIAIIGPVGSGKVCLCAIDLFILMISLFRVPSFRLSWVSCPLLAGRYQ